ncbi:MAG: prepilin-type N-terminal cleavage/methylation domain-containing protein [Parasphingorhabdus sp.]
MPTSKPFPSQKPNGFTLIEMLVVLSILSLAAVLFIGSTSGGNGIETRTVTQNLKQKIVQTRQRAVDRSIAQAVELEGADIKFTPVIGASENLIFYADGSSNGGVYKSQKRTIMTVRWLDGAVTK